MPSTRFQIAAPFHLRPSNSQPGFAHRLSARRDPDDDWYDDEPDPLGDEPWNPDALDDDDEPQPEPGDFWPEIDDD